MTLLEIIDREGRFGAWVTSAALLSISVTMMVPGDTMRYSDWWSLRAYGVTEAILAGVLMGVAVFRISALIVNGWWHRTPILRGIGATVGGIIFAWFAMLSGWPWVVGEVAAPDVVVGFYVIFVLCDIREITRAGADHRSVGDVSLVH